MSDRVNWKMLRGVEHDWLATDRDGRVAVFCTAGSGVAPEVVARHFELYDWAVEAVAGLPVLAPTPAVPETRMGPGTTLRNYAERGLFVYDGDYNGGPYRLVAQPTVGATIGTLSSGVAAMARWFCFRQVRFADSHLIDEALVEAAETELRRRDRAALAAAPAPTSESEGLVWTLAEHCARAFPPPSDRALRRMLQALGYGADSVEHALAFAPIAFGRHLFDGEGIAYSSDYTAGPSPFANRALQKASMYRTARALALRLGDTSLFRELALRSAETSAILELASHGVGLDGVALTPPLLPSVNSRSR